MKSIAVAFALRRLARPRWSAQPVGQAGDLTAAGSARAGRGGVTCTRAGRARAPALRHHQHGIAAPGRCDTSAPSAPPLARSRPRRSQCRPAYRRAPARRRDRNTARPRRRRQLRDGGRGQTEEDSEAAARRNMSSPLVRVFVLCGRAGDVCHPARATAGGLLSRPSSLSHFSAWVTIRSRSS